MDFNIPHFNTPSTLDGKSFDRTWYQFLVNLFQTTGNGSLGIQNQVLHGGGGGYSAISLSDLSPLGLVSGHVRMVFLNSAWSVFAPDGTAVSTTGTTTSGLQEAINYAQTNGYPLEVWGPGATAAGTQPAVITCTTTVALGPICQLGILIRNAIISWGAGVAVNGMTIDSCDTMNIEIDALLNYAGSGDSVVLVKPTSNYPINAATNIQGSKFRIKEILASGGTVSKLIRFSTANGPISNTMFDLGYLLGGGFASYGIYIENPPTAPKAFNNNHINFGLIVSCSTASIQVGTSALVQATQPLASNWFQGSIETNGTSADGIICYGFLNTFDVNISVDSGTLARGYNFAANTATDNHVLAKQIVATAEVVDSGARNFFARSCMANFHVHKGVDQTGILPTTPTLVTWDQVDFDNAFQGVGAFSTTNSWYVAPYRGIMSIKAKVRVTTNFTPGDNEIGVYVNGAAKELTTTAGTVNDDTLAVNGNILVNVGDQVSVEVNLAGVGNKTIPFTGFAPYTNFSGCYTGVG